MAITVHTPDGGTTRHESPVDFDFTDQGYLLLYPVSLNDKTRRNLATSVYAPGSWTSAHTDHVEPMTEGA